ncbi:MAG: hypothetical protein AAF569_08810 [Pseudomonadota bacterium]
MTIYEYRTTFLEWFSQQKDVGEKTLESVDQILRNRSRALHSDPEIENLFNVRIYNRLMRSLIKSTDAGLIAQAGKSKEFRQVRDKKESQLEKSYGAAWLICIAETFEEVLNIPYVPLADLAQQPQKSEHTLGDSDLGNTLLLQDLILSTLGHNDGNQPIPRLHDIHLDLDNITRKQYGKFVVNPAVDAMIRSNDMQSSTNRQQFEQQVIVAKGADVLKKPQTREQADNLLLRTLVHIGLLPGNLQDGNES